MMATTTRMQGRYDHRLRNLVSITPVDRLAVNVVELEASFTAKLSPFAHVTGMSRFVPRATPVPNRVGSVWTLKVPRNPAEIHGVMRAKRVFASSSSELLGEGMIDAAASGLDLSYQHRSVISGQTLLRGDCEDVYRTALDSVVWYGV